jgi:hypothetical protein
MPPFVLLSTCLGYVASDATSSPSIANVPPSKIRVVYKRDTLAQIINSSAGTWKGYNKELEKHLLRDTTADVYPTGFSAWYGPDHQEGAATGMQTTLLALEPRSTQLYGVLLARMLNWLPILYPRAPSSACLDLACFPLPAFHLQSVAGKA